jgi:hypothetical protein
MVLDLFTLGGFFLFVAMVAALIATHDFHQPPSAGRAATGPAENPRRHNR